VKAPSFATDSLACSAWRSSKRTRRHCPHEQWKWWSVGEELTATTHNRDVKFKQTHILLLRQDIQLLSNLL